MCDSDVRYRPKVCCLSGVTPRLKNPLPRFDDASRSNDSRDVEWAEGGEGLRGGWLYWFLGWHCRSAADWSVLSRDGRLAIGKKIRRVCYEKLVSDRIRVASLRPSSCHGPVFQPCVYYCCAYCMPANSVCVWCLNLKPVECVVAQRCRQFGTTPRLASSASRSKNGRAPWLPVARSFLQKTEEEN